MTRGSKHPLVVDYLDRLRRAGRRLPRGRRAELVGEIEAHLGEALRPDASDAEVLTALDRLGEPDAIIDAEQSAAPVVADPRGVREWAAIFLLLFGGFIAGVGWLVGLVLLCSSRAWTAKDKWLGALIVPGGLALPVFGLGIAGLAGGRTCTSIDNRPEVCTGGASGTMQLVWISLTLLLLVAPVVTAVHLARRAS